MNTCGMASDLAATRPGIAGSPLPSPRNDALSNSVGCMRPTGPGGSRSVRILRRRTAHVRSASSRQTPGPPVSRGPSSRRESSQVRPALASSSSSPAAASLALAFRGLEQAPRPPRLSRRTWRRDEIVDLGGKSPVEKVEALAEAAMGQDPEMDLELYDAIIRVPLPPRGTATGLLPDPLPLVSLPREGVNMLDLPRGSHHGVPLGSSPQTPAETERAFKMLRLEKGLEVLERLQAHGNLDTSKVYHKRFFEECKAVRSVPLASRFLGLMAGAGCAEERRRVGTRGLLQLFTLHMALCAHCKDGTAALQAMRLARESGVVPDTSLYTALITALCKSSQLDMAFKFFYEMESHGATPNSHTICALIYGCGEAKLIAKAFGLYGLMQSKNLRPDRAVYNALITACVRAGATERAFDILEDMQQEEDTQLTANCVTAGALLAAPVSTPAQRERALLLYQSQLSRHERLLQGGQAEAELRGSTALPGGTPGSTGRKGETSRGSLTPTEEGGVAKQGCSQDLLRMCTAAVHACSAPGDWAQALRVFQDLQGMPGVQLDGVFGSAMLDVARHAGKVGEGEAVLEELEMQRGVEVGPALVNALMALYAQMKLKDKAIALYRKVQQKAREEGSTETLRGPAFNALISLLCKEGALEDALQVAAEMRSACPCGGPDKGTYTLLLEACLRNEGDSSRRERGQGDREGESRLKEEEKAEVAEGGGLLALQLYQMARQQNVRIGLRLCEVMLEICSEMEAKGAPPPAVQLVQALRSQEATPGKVEEVLSGSTTSWQRFPPPTSNEVGGGSEFPLPHTARKGKRNTRGGPRFWPKSRDEEQDGSSDKESESEGHTSSIGSASFPIAGWRLVAVTVYEHSLSSGVVPTLNVFSKLLALLRVHLKPARGTKTPAESALPLGPEPLAFHPVAFVLYQEAEKLGAFPSVSSSVGPLSLRLESFPSHLAELSLLLVLRRLERRLRAAPGLMLFPLSIHLPVAQQDLVLKKAEATSRRSSCQAQKAPSMDLSKMSKKTNNGKTSPPKTFSPVRQIPLGSRTGHAVASLLRRLGLPMMGYESEGVLRVTAGALTQWLRKEGARLGDGGGNLGTTEAANGQSTTETPSVTLGWTGYSDPSNEPSAYLLPGKQDQQSRWRGRAGEQSPSFTAADRVRQPNLAGARRSAQVECDTAQQMLKGRSLSKHSQAIRTAQWEEDA